MTKRLVIKAILITFGFMLLIFSAISFVFLKNNQIDNERRFNVLVATKDINPGEELNETLVTYKTIKESALNEHMIFNKNEIKYKKSTYKILSGDYVSKYMLLQSLPKDKDKIIVLPMDVDTRLANQINKNSLVDIKIQQKDKIPQIVLAKVKVEDILDENGIKVETTAVGVKKCYGKFILNEEQRNKIYVASSVGKLIFELYIDNIQNPPSEEFVIPYSFLNNITTPIPTPLPTPVPTIPAVMPMSTP